MRNLLRCLLACAAMVTFAATAALPASAAKEKRGIETHSSANPARPVPPPDPASPSAQPGIFLGTAWYPEQWPESRWDADLALMEQAHIRFVRVGEFAWSTMEPQEGQYHFDWLERAIRAAERHKIFVVLGTPTAAPPAWLTKKYPDTLRTDSDGRLAEHGNRQQFSFASPRYREFCRKIATEMATRFGHDPDVIGWQIDNEYATTSYDAETRRQFQAWLQKKFGTLASLNQHWATAYWSQTYDAWDEIPIPNPSGNPGLMLEWRRFISDTWRSYQANQLDAIRKNFDPRQWITTNFMGLFDLFDHYVVSADLDMASWDDYIGQGHLDAVANGFVHDLTRGFKRKNFWVMETQPDHVNWAPVNNSLDKGEVREMAWNAIGHGADAVGYWQWRSALGGQEQYHGTLVGADGNPVPLYPEVQQIGADFEKAGDLLRGTSIVSSVAMLNSYDNRWAIDFQRHNRNYDVIANMMTYYRPLRELVDSVDVVAPMAPLDAYKIVLAPDLNLLPPDQPRHLLDFVQAGGHLVLGPRSGMKDEYNELLPSLQPGPLEPALGAKVLQYYALENPIPAGGDLGSGQAKIWAELLSTQQGAAAPDAQVLLRYGKSNGWLDGQAAVVTRPYGRGRITYVGAWLDDTLMKQFTAWLLRTTPIETQFSNVPAGVEICHRVRPASASGSGATDVYIVINHSTQQQQLTLPYEMKDALHPGAPQTRLTLAPRDVAVLSK